MTTATFIVYDNEIIVNNISILKEFSDKKFVLQIGSELYEITGNDLVLKEVSNDNKTIKITGKLESIDKMNKQAKEKNKGFLKKLFA